MKIRLMTTQSPPGRSTFRYIHADTVESGGDPYALLLPGDRQQASVMLDPNSGLARIEFTLSSLTDIEEDNAIWHNWPLGSVDTAVVDAVMTPVTALRCVAQVSARWEVVA